MCTSIKHFNFKFIIIEEGFSGGIDTSGNVELPENELPKSNHPPIVIFKDTRVNTLKVIEMVVEKYRTYPMRGQNTKYSITVLVLDTTDEKLEKMKSEYLSDHKISRWVQEDTVGVGQHGFEDEFVIVVTTNFFKAENLSRGRNQLAIILDVPEKCRTFM